MGPADPPGRNEDPHRCYSPGMPAVTSSTRNDPARGLCWTPLRLALRLGRTCGALALVLAAGLGVAQDEAPFRLQVASNLTDRYVQGSEHDLTVRVALVDPSAAVAQGVLFLNVVEVKDDGTSPQAMHRVFASAQTSQTVFRTPLDGATLRGGVEATVHVRFRDRAPPGVYAMVIQLFEGSQTDPHAVQVENRIAMHSLEFDVVPEGAAQ